MLKQKTVTEAPPNSRAYYKNIVLGNKMCTALMFLGVWGMLSQTGEVTMAALLAAFSIYSLVSLPAMYEFCILFADLNINRFSEFRNTVTSDMNQTDRKPWRLWGKFCRASEAEKPAVQHLLFPCWHSLNVGLNELRSFLLACCLKDLVSCLLFEKQTLWRALVSVF